MPLNRQPLSRRHNGFTLIEVIVAMVILAIILALTLAGTKALRATSQATACLGSLRTIGAGLLAYAMDHRAKLPTRKKSDNDGVRIYYWMEVLQESRYIDSTLAPEGRLWSCPTGQRSIRPTECYGLRDWGDKGLSVGLDDELPIARISQPSRFFLVADSVQLGESEPRQWYTIQRKGGNNAVHLRHNGRANAVFADGHAEAAKREYYESHHLHEPAVMSTEGLPFKTHESVE